MNSASSIVHRRAARVGPIMLKAITENKETSIFEVQLPKQQNEIITNWKYSN